MSTRQAYETAGEEPALIEVLADPLIHAVMRRDGVTIAELCSAIRTAKRRLGIIEGSVVAFPPNLADRRGPVEPTRVCA